MDTLGFIKDRVGLFKGFSADHLKKLIDGSRVKSFEAKEAIMHHGDAATHLGVVLSGEVVAGTNGQNLGELKAGATFAELSLMSGEPLLAEIGECWQCGPTS